MHVLNAARLRETPVQDDRLAEFSDHHVRGLDVPVEHGAAVGICDGLARSTKWGNSARRACQPPSRRMARARFLRGPASWCSKAARPAVAQLIHRHDGRVLKLSGDSGFLKETVDSGTESRTGLSRPWRGVAAVGDVGEQFLHRDIAAQVGVVDQKYPAHAAAGVFAVAA